MGRDGDMCVPCFIGAGEPLPVAEPAPASSRLLEAADMMSKILEEAESKHFHQFFCNGVHAPGGMCEGEKWASEAVEELREAIAAEREPEEARQAADVMRELLIEARDERDDLKRQLAEAKEHADGALSLMRAKEAEAAMATKRAEKAEAALECETDNIAAILDNSDVGGQPHDLHDRIEFMCAKAADTEKAEAAGDAKGLNAKLLALREWVGLVDDNVAVNRWLLRGKIDYLLAEPAEEPAAEDRGDDGFEEWRKYQQGYADPKPAYVKAINELIRRAVGGGGR